MASRYTPQRVARLVKNPGTRATVPTKYLPAQYRRQRELNARLAQPVVPGSSYTGRDAARERNASVDLRYGPLDQQLGQQLQRSQQVQQAIPGWYDQYRQLLAAAQSGVKQGYDAATQQFQALQAGTAGAQGQQQLAGYQQQAAQLGQIADPAAAQVAANAAQVRGAMAGNLGSVLVAQGANQNAYGQNLTANTGAHQIESILGELQNERNVRSDQSQLAREKGAYATTTDASIKDRERKAVLENQAFGLQVANTAADNQRADAQQKYTKDHNAAVTKRQQREAGEKITKYGVPEKQWRTWSTSHRQRVMDAYEKNGGSGSGSGSGAKPGADGAKPATPAARQRANSQIQYAITQAKRMKGGKFSRKQAGDTLVIGRPGAKGQPGINKVDQLYASIALDVAYNGFVSRPNARKLHDLGLTVKDLGLRSYGQAMDRAKRQIRQDLSR